jgi:hypothetical protein
VLYAESIIPCKRNDEIKITENDIAAFERFVNHPNLME